MQTRINIDERQFNWHDVLKLVEGLTEKTFRNWSDRGLIVSRVERGRRLLSAVDVIKLTAMVEAVEFGVPPTTAADLADQITPNIYELAAGLPDFPQGRGTLVLPTTRQRPFFYACFEVNFLIGTMFARIIAHLEQKPAKAPARKRKAAKKGAANDAAAKPRASRRSDGRSR